jgi:hypothetical protein
MSVALHTADGNRYIVDQAETFSVIGKSMVEAASNVDATVISQRLTGGDNRSPGHVPESLYKFFAVGDFQLQFLARAQGSLLQFVNPEPGVDEKEICFLAGLCRQEIGFGEGSGSQQALPHLAVFGCVEYVLTDR